MCIIEINRKYPAGKEQIADELFNLISKIGYKRFIALAKMISENEPMPRIADTFNRSRQMIYKYRKSFFVEKYILSDFAKKIVEIYEEEKFFINNYELKNNLWDYKFTNDYETLKKIADNRY